MKLYDCTRWRIAFPFRFLKFQAMSASRLFLLKMPDSMNTLALISFALRVLPGKTLKREVTCRARQLLRSS